MSEDKGNKKKVVQKYNLDEVEDIWNFVLSESPDLDEDGDDLDDLLYGDGENQGLAGEYDHGAESAADQFAGEDLPYDESGPGEGPEDLTALGDGGQPAFAEGEEEEAREDSGYEQPPLEEEEEVAAGADTYSAVLEYVGGMRQEVAEARLFQPQNNSVLLRDAETGDEVTVLFEQLACLELSGLPAGVSARWQEGAEKECIETVDGTRHQVLVSARQNLAGLLLCFSPDAQTQFPVILLPRANIRKRCQDRPLTDIMLEKRFISRTILQRAIQEFEQIKGMSLRKILAQRTRVPLADIEKVLDDARENQMAGLQTGEILLISGLFDEKQILDALEYHEHLQNMDIDAFLMEKGFVKEIEIYLCLADKYRLPFLDLRQRKIPKESLALLPGAMMQQHEILPLVKKDDTLLVASHLVDPTGLDETIAKASGCSQVRYVLAPPSHIRKAIQLLCA